MKINAQDPYSRLKSTLNQVEESDSSKPKERASVGSSTSPRAGGVDDLALSARALELQQLRQAIDESPDVRRDLVESLRSEISTGRYRIDGTRIAQALLGESQVDSNDATAS